MDYKKLLWAIVGVLVLGIKDALTDGGVSSIEMITIGGLVLGALGTWIVPNTPQLYTAKTWVNAVGAGTALLAILATDGIQGDDWLDMVICVLTTAGVLAIPNAKVLPMSSRSAVPPGGIARAA